MSRRGSGSRGRFVPRACSSARHMECHRSLVKRETWSRWFANRTIPVDLSALHRHLVERLSALHGAKYLRIIELKCRRPRPTRFAKTLLRDEAVTSHTFVA